METIIWSEEKYKKFLENNFQKDWENMFPGYRSPTYERFNKVGERMSYWLSDGSHVNIDKDGMYHHDYGYSCGLSLRFLKN